MAKYILALDQGTTSSRSILFTHKGIAVETAQKEFEQIFPSPGHVEHDPEAIWKTQIGTARQVLRKAKAGPEDVAAIGITNQRETTVLWERESGKPVHNAIVWQSRVTAPICDRMKADGLEPTFRKKTGLVIDAYFSGTKVKYLLDRDKGLRRRAEKGEILFGTIDTYLLWRLTGGRVHATDVTNASRTLLYNIHTLEWDDELLNILGVPREMLPEVKASSVEFGVTEKKLFGREIPIAGIAGDQQAATFGQGCFKKGMAKNTYGTGTFLLLNTGEEPVESKHGLVTTIGWQIGGRTTYCLEGSVFIAGAAVQWLRDGLKLIRKSSDIRKLAATEKDSGGIYFVPAFVGLGAPYWDQDARGVIVGLTRGTTGGHLARATVESMAYQSKDLVDAMEADSGVKLKKLRVDGGAVVDDGLMQFQADILGRPVERPRVHETTALGAAYLAGLGVGFWKDQKSVTDNWALDRTFEPDMSGKERKERYEGWKRAVERAKDWV